MKAMTKILAGAAGLAAVVSAAPAAAQYGYGYPNSGGNVIGQVLGQILGYGKYPYGNYGYGQSSYMANQVAVEQCARAAEARLNGYGGYNNGYGGYNNGYGGYNNGYGYNGYNNGYANGGRVLGIEKVSIKSGGRIRVMGVASTGQRYNQTWGYGGYAYNSQYGVPDTKFVCNADRNGRVFDVNLSRYNGYSNYGYRRY